MPLYKFSKNFQTGLRDLYHKGGPYQKAAEKVRSVIGYISLSPESDPLSDLKVTNHGETRIKKCVKYDLTGGSRLITIQDKGVVLFCFAGTHDDCDRWLDANRGTTLIKNNSAQIDITPISTGNSPQERLSGVGALTGGKLYEKLQPESYFDRLIEEIPRSIIRELENLESIDEEDYIGKLILKIENGKQGQAVYDVFCLLRQDKRQEALERTKVYLGEVKPINELTEDEINELADSEKIKTIPSNDKRFQIIFERFVKSASYMDWMLFLHPDQQRIVDSDYSGPTKLAGISGSGKTCIIVHRAIQLAQKYAGEKILVLTLNRQLARLIDDMVNAACIPTIRQHIEVMPFFNLCQELLLQFEPKNSKLYDDRTWKSKEHIDEIWREFYRCEVNVLDAEILLPLHDSLLTRKVDPELYIREEMDWLRSAVPPTDRNQYLERKREGRGYPLDQKFRQSVIDGLMHWERKMDEVGVTDYLGLSTALYKYKINLKNQYRSILVDEAQDFGTTELELIRCLVGENENDLFFCGDLAQQVSTKHLSFKDAGINMPSARSITIKKNYRNSREILKAAYNVLFNNMTEATLKSTDFEVLDPEYANFSATVPLMLKANNLEQEISFALAFINDYLKNDAGKKGCMGMCGYSLYQIQHFGKKHGIKVLDGEITIEKESIYLSDLEHMKGFEFDVVVLVNGNENVIPNQSQPEEEQHRDLSRLYVAMTRAKDQLVLSYSKEPSKYLLNAENDFLPGKWGEYSGCSSDPISLGMPLTLNQIREEHFQAQAGSPLDMSGPQFLYTHHALGLDQLLIEKIRGFITGKSIWRDGIPIQWKSLNDLKDAIDSDYSLKLNRILGPEGISQFKKLIKKLK